MKFSQFCQGMVIALGALVLTPSATLMVPLAFSGARANSAAMSSEDVSTAADPRAATLDREVTTAQLPVLRCNLKVGNPHNSSHVRGTINVVAALSCKGLNAASMTVSVVLAKTVCTPNCHAVSVGSVNTNSVTYQPSVQANSSTSCSPGSYFGTASGYLVAPPGVKPPTGHLEASSATVRITC